MERNIEKISNGKVKLTWRLTAAETAAYEAKALRTLGARANFSGFRPGKAPEDVVRAKLGEAAIQEEVLHQAAEDLYPKLVRDENLELVGRPELTLVTSQPLVFILTVSQLPSVNTGKWNKVKVKQKPVVVDEKELDELMAELQDSRATESAVDRAAAMGDRVEIDFEVAVDNVVIDGGKGIKYPLVLGKGRMIPGFEDNLVWLKAGEEKKFNLTFPKDYVRHLAGKSATVRAKMNQVFERKLPEINDAFAAGLGGFTTAKELRDKLKENVLEEHTNKERDRVEKEMWEALLGVASFEPLPDTLLENELDKMIQELSQSIEERGLKWVDYLQSVKRDEATLRKEFRAQAEKRVKLALLVRAFAKESKLQADEMDIEREISHTLEHYGNDERVAAQLQSEDYRDYVRTVLTNRRVLEWLKKQLVEEEKK